MVAEKPKHPLIKRTYTNKAGETIHEHHDGTHHLEPNRHMEAKILQSHDDLRAAQEELHSEKHQLIENKKAIQRKNGWPPSKSPI
jgi:hypothetical protein